MPAPDDELANDVPAPMQDKVWDPTDSLARDARVVGHAAFWMAAAGSTFETRDEE